ncbi:MAG TPA: efflux RND transporter periplasmic adaptor subunit [Gemmataceae bacterium]|jgi:RNA polymerase sigma factor (sigma-70 family)
MARRKVTDVVRYLQQISAAAGAGLTDAELLERYVRHRDEAAFELLLWRHGVLVFNVCRRVLSREQDAEDAFQATFLAFVRKAHAIVRGGSVSSWLYKVAYRVALEARARARKTAQRERPGGEALAVQPSPDPMWEDLRPILDEELNRLPERLRRPFVLCYLEGKTNEEAARQLGCRPGTIFSRLARGRELLRNRLGRRGVTLSAVALTAALGQHAAEAVPAAPLLMAALRAALLYAGGQAAGHISIQVTALAEGVLRAMFVTKLKMAALMLFVVGLLAAGGVLTRQALNAAPQPEAQTEQKLVSPKVAAKAEDKKTVRAVLPTPGGLHRTTEGAGHVRAAAQQQVYPAVAGFLKQPLVDIGDRVKKGQLLVALDAPLLVKDSEQAAAALQLAKGQYLEAKAHVVTTTAELKAAEGRIRECERKLSSDKTYLTFRKKQLQRYQELFRTGSIEQRLVDEQEDRHASAVEAVAASEAALESARSVIAVRESKIESAKAALDGMEASLKMVQIALDKARLKVTYTQIAAEYDGVVTQRNFDAGDFIPAADQGTRRPLLTVLRTDAVRVRVDVPQGDVPFIRAGVAVELRADALPGVKLPISKVSRIGFSIDESTGTMPLEIDVANAKELLRPGMSMTAVIHLDKKAPADAITIPSSSVVKRREREYVYIVRDGKAHLTPVYPSYRGEGRVEIASGVKASDRIVVDPGGLEGEVVPVEVKKMP